MNKFDKEDRNIVILIIIFLLLLSVYFIYRLLNPEIENNNKEVFKEYVLLNESNNYKYYRISERNINNFDIFINDVNIKYNNRELTIDEQLVKDNIIVIDKVAFYDHIMVMFAVDIINGYSYFIQYNKNNREAKVLNKINDMFIYEPDNVELAEAGIRLSLSKRFDNVLFINDKEYDLCSYKDDKLIESVDIMLFYNSDTDEFSDSDIISKRYLKDIKKDICYEVNPK